MRFACWATKVTDIHSEYVIPLHFPWQQRLCKRASVLFYIYSVCLVEFQCVFLCEMADAPAGQSAVDLSCVSACMDAYHMASAVYE